MFEIHERFDFQAALERARKVLSNPNGEVECVRGVSIDAQEAERQAHAFRRRAPHTQRGWIADQDCEASSVENEDVHAV
jgi:hypothetical protein